jgi:hypothetical protein
VLVVVKHLLESPTFEGYIRDALPVVGSDCQLILRTNKSHTRLAIFAEAYIRLVGLLEAIPLKMALVIQIAIDDVVYVYCFHISAMHGAHSIRINIRYFTIAANDTARDLRRLLKIF